MCDTWKHTAEIVSETGFLKPNMEPQDLSQKTKLGRNHLHQVRSDEGPQYNSLLLGGPGLSPGQVGDVQPPPESKEVSKVYPLVNLTARAMEDMANLQMIDIQ